MSKTDVNQQREHALVPTRDTMRDAALCLVARGFAVFPCWGVRPVTPWHGENILICACPRWATCGRDAGKHPVYAGGFKHATADPELVRLIWRRGAFNVGVDLGGSGLLVVDLDSRSAVEWWHRVWDVDTLTVSTARGLHVYFRQPPTDLLGSIGTSVFQRFTGVTGEVKGSGGYVLGPGSRHVSGSSYDIVQDRTPVTVPLELLADLYEMRPRPVHRSPTSTSRPTSTSATTNRPTPQSVGYWLDRLAGSTEPGRNAMAHVVAHRLREAVDVGALTIAAAERLFFSAGQRCGIAGPGAPADEIRKTGDLFRRAVAEGTCCRGR